MKTWVIYCHLNKINGKRYIGLSSNNLSHRWGRGSGYKDQARFKAAIKKYGWDNFEHLILEKNIPTLKEANEREQYWIEYYHTWIYDPQCWGYNTTKGGDGTLGHIQIPDTVAQIKRTLASHRYKQVFCIETGKVYNSCSAAAREINVSPAMIHNCVNKRNILGGGFHWAYIEDVEYIKYLKTLIGVKKKGARQCKVICIETAEQFSYVKDAAAKYGIKACHISACCKGKRKTCGGFHWKYLE